MPTLTLQGAFTAGELTPSLTGRVDLAKYSLGCRTLKNMLVQPHGGATKRPGFLLLDSLPGEARIIPFVFNVSQSYALVFGEKWMQVAMPDGFVLDENGQPLQVATPYSLYQAKNLSYAQSGDILFLANHDICPHKLKRLDHNKWAFEAMTFVPMIEPPTGVTGRGVNNATKSDGTGQPAVLVTPYTYVVTAVNEEGEESEASDGWDFTGPANNCWYAGYRVEVSWQAVTGAVEYRVYKKEFGGRPGFLAATGDTQYHDYNTRPLLSDGPPQWKNPFEGEDYPRTVGFFEQRLVFASTPKRPQTVWMSRTGDYDNFSTSIPLKDSDSLELTIASNEVSAILWLISLRSLMVGCGGAEWEVASTEGAFTARSAKATPQSYRGSSPVRALVVGNTLLHVARSGQEVRDLKYDFGADSYSGLDRSILAKHLLSGNRCVRDWTYQPSPDSIIWAVRDDGVLLGMTFQAEHEVFAWHQHHTPGLFCAVCALPTGQKDVLFAVIKRRERFYLEVMADQYEAGRPARECVYLDNAARYEGAPVQAVSGLGHLEGQEVGILADGAALSPRVVKDGSVTLDKMVTSAIVGLPYVGDLETMPVEMVGQQGSSVGHKKAVNSVMVLFHETASAKVGCSFSRLETVAFRTTEAHGQPTSPYSGTKRVIVPEYGRNTVTVCVRSDVPLPLTVLSVMPEVDVK